MGSKEPVHPPDTRDLTRDTSESGPRGLEQTAEVGETLRASPGAGGAFLPHGSWLDKSYRVKDLLGRGAMGAVYLVEHVELGKEFAAKVVAGAHGLDPAAITRLRNEARMASSIDHENIVGVSHLGTLPDGSVFVVMERLRGEDLRARMERRRAAGDPWLPDDEVRAIVPPLLSALASAHAAGIVHRDLKPDNIFLHHRRGLITPKIVDFGIGKLRNAEEDLRLTATGQIIGTPLYMAPEQSRSSDIVDHRTDLYSMGVVLYELLTGRLPFDAKSLYELVVKHVTETPPDPRTLRADLPDPVAELLLRCLQKAPDARPQTADELSRAWREAWGEPAGLPAAPSFPASGELGLYESGAHEGGLGSSPRFDSANEATAPALATSQSVTVAAQIAEARPAPARGRGRVAVAGVAALVVTLALGIWLVGAEGEDVGAPAPTAAPIAAETTAARASTSASDELVLRDELARSPSSALAPTEGVSPGARADDDAASREARSADDTARRELGAASDAAAGEARAAGGELAPSSAPSVQAAPARRHRIESTPSGAEVWRGGARLGATPFTLELARDEVATLELRMRGRTTAELTVAPDAAELLTATLRPVPRRPSNYPGLAPR